MYLLGNIITQYEHLYQPSLGNLGIIPKIFTLAPESTRPPEKPDRKPMGQWLVENMPRGINLEIPDGRASKRAIPFIDEAEE